MLILDGQAVAEARRERLKSQVQMFQSQHRRTPGLAVILVGQDPASQVYVRNKVRICDQLEMRSQKIELAESVSERELLGHISDLNQDASVDGILVQLPLPKHLDVNRVISAIRPEKDPDGLTDENIGRLWAGRARVKPCTPAGVIAILDHYQIPLKKTHAVIVGRSQTVGRPMAQLLLERDATVTVCHSQTENLESFTQKADLVVVAAGRERFLGRSAFAKGAVVVDVGIHRPTSGSFQGKLCGDVRFDELKDWVQAATPVPGGVGPMTIQMLMENTFHLAQLAET